ncbi:MAG: ATP-binding protein [Cyclobacteriaceae bacterium]
MVDRKIEAKTRELASQFKALAILGPRQSGKTTLSKYVFKDKPYVSLENPDTRAFATDDPRGFLNQFPQGAILDEIQRVPQIFSYLQQILDEHSASGQFILTGSNNFLLQENISQTLAGRIAFLYLLPFSIQELRGTRMMPDNLDLAMLKGGYPPIYDRQISPGNWYPNYIRTYVERDVRQIKNISNLALFDRFLKLCAGRVGQLLNLNSLGIETGVDHKTISSWISILESSFIIHLLRPHHQNYNKRLVKMPKLYFYDTGLACSLLGLQKKEHITTHPLRGSLFENFIVSEIIKNHLNENQIGNIYFWRDHTGHEVDVIIDNGRSLQPIEIKSGQTVNDDFFKGLKQWFKISGQSKGTVIYGGQTSLTYSEGINILPWEGVTSINAEDQNRLANG